MEGVSRGGRGKRKLDAFEAYGEGLACGAMSLESTVADALSAPMDDLSFPLAKSPPVFVNASAASMAAFDFSELTGVLSLNQSFGSIESCLEPSLSVFVPGVQRQVEIPKQLMFKEVCSRLSLKLYGMGLVMESSEVCCAWIDIEIPNSKGEKTVGRQKFYGQGCCTKYAAVESVCSVVLTEFVRHYDVVVKDFCYPRLKVVEKNFARELEWNGLVREELAKEKKKNEAMKQRSVNLLEDIMKVCEEFADMLPIQVRRETDIVNGSALAKIVYNGQRPPVSRTEELAFALANVVTANDEL